MTTPLTDLTDLTGKAILITGATGALGRAVATAARQAGARVYPTWILERDRDTASALAGDTGLAIEADVSQPGGANHAVGAVLKHAGRLDGAVCIVGGYDGGTPVGGIDLERWDAQIAINLTSTLLVARAALPPMLTQDAGRLVTVGSRAVLRPAAGQAPYQVAKAGVMALTETIAEEVKLTGVTANCIVPSTMDTPANRASMPDADFDRWPKPEQIAPVVLFLLSDASAVVNGAAIPVFGKDR